jgi:N-acetylated-alpha-linked acidic dipeptidase
MKASCPPFLMLCACAAVAVPLVAQDSIRGFSPKDAAAEKRIEEQARAVPDPSRLRADMEFMAALPHHAGSPRDKVVAEWILAQLKQWGLDAHFEEFEPLLPYPTIRELSVVSPKPYTAKLKEPSVPEDPTGGDATQLPPYNAYSASGDVTSDVVYVNYGVPDDYEYLTKHGIDVKGKIVIARYGKSWRGIKPKVAAEHGAIACLIYSDPKDDGYFDGDVFPKGPMRPDQGVQRGSVMDMPLYSGDPLTPGWAAEKGAKRLSRSEAKSLMTIPVMPISYGDALPILEQLTGPVAPASWRGALALTYHLGPGPAKVHMKTDYDWSLRPIYDVVATIPGAKFPDEWVLAGNHHDAWVNGADDPVSGAVALLETARSLAKLAAGGWRPDRTVKLMWWDAEEFGLIGSTEWAEKHQDELKQKAVAYINSDSNGAGWLHVSGSHTLELFAAETALSIQQPNSTQSLADASLHHPDPDDDPERAVREHERDRKDFHIDALGAGSDYVAFLDFLGIASMNDGFGGAGRGGIYHSAYDSIYWYTHFSDKDFMNGQALSRYTATALLRLADADILPFEFGHFASTVNGYLDEIQKDAGKNNHKLDLAPLHEQLDLLAANGKAYDAALKTALAKDSLDPRHLAALNRVLFQSERVLTRPEGLPNRAWYKHQIYAPGFYTGYGVKTVPGVREAVDSKNWDLAAKEVAVVTTCLEALNAAVKDAISDAQGL